MRNKNLKDLRIENDDVKVKMMDDGYCEYDRIGVGVMNGNVFVCDLEFVDYGRLDYKEVFNDGSELKYFWFVNFDSVEECCKSGCESGWCVEWKDNWGYGSDDKYRVKSGEGLNDVDGVEYKEGDENRFDDWVKENEVK